ncbi:aldo/keto reductase [Clostridium sp. Mt-5]|uniref:Aldo/keto reductase n=1 Tax=Clostridium moutaii TaxID=3240932 RepID=A0ABV4BPM1_9CLOT
MNLISERQIEKIRSGNERRKVKLPDGTFVPALGQGTWYLGENASSREREIRTLKLGIELGMTLVDTAEMYGDGGSERLVGEAISGIRDSIFLVSKVYPHNAGFKNIFTACENSLRRLGTDHLDMYLLHWRGNIPFEETIECMEKLKKQGKILRWGVSNLDTTDMEELMSCRSGENCMVNQVLYHLGSRGIEFDLLPWQRRHHMPVMAYCPLAKGGRLKEQLLKDKVVNEIALKYGVKPLQILLAWVIREDDVIAVPKASREEHVIENAESGSIVLSKADLDKLDKVFPEPDRKMSLEIL